MTSPMVKVIVSPALYLNSPAVPVSPVLPVNPDEVVYVTPETKLSVN